MKKTYPILAFFVLFIIGFGLVNLLKEDLELAPWAEESAEEGRLIANTKNVTRLVSANAADLRSYLNKAVPYATEKNDTISLNENNWEDYFLSLLKVNPGVKHVVIVPGGSMDALKWSLPALYFAYQNGSPVVFVMNGQIEEGVFAGTDLTAYLVGPKDLIPDEIDRIFKRRVRLTAATPHRLAVKIARYHDEETGFGWGRSHDRRNGYFQYVVTTPHDALQGLAAIVMAKSNYASLLYASEDGSLPAVLDHYVFSIRTDWMVSPSEGPFRHFWIVSNRIGYGSQGRLDFSIEKSDYPSKGPVALGETEALMLILIIWGIASAIFVWVHATFTLSMVKMPLKIAWAMSSLLLPVLGPVLYLNSYRKPAIQSESGEWTWIRPHSLQSASATAMGFGYGAPLMIAIGFLLVWFGFPIFYPESIADKLFWLGAGMPIMMFAMYVLAVLFAWKLVQYPMKKAMMPDMPDKMINKMSLITTALSMLSVSIGMMTTSWYLLMSRFPMMPKEDDVLWFGSMWLASFIGFLIAWPINWLLIRNHLKPGNR